MHFNFPNLLSMSLCRFLPLLDLKFEEEIKYKLTINQSINVKGATGSCILFWFFTWGLADWLNQIKEPSSSYFLWISSLWCFSKMFNFVFCLNSTKAKFYVKRWFLLTKTFCWKEDILDTLYNFSLYLWWKKYLKTFYVVFCASKNFALQTAQWATSAKVASVNRKPWAVITRNILHERDVGGEGGGVEGKHGQGMREGWRGDMGNGIICI